MEPWKILPLWVRVDIRIMVMAGYSTFPKDQGQESHHQIQFLIITRRITYTGQIDLLTHYLCLYLTLVLFYGVSTHFGLFKAEFNFNQFTLVEVCFFVYKKLNFKTVQLNVKTILFRIILFSISTQFSFNLKNSSISSNSVQHKFTIYFYLTDR